MAHVGFPNIDAIQLCAGCFEGAIFSELIGECRVCAGSANRTILYEGLYTPGMVHIGLIVSPDHTAIVHAHAYNAGVIALHHNAVYMHEVFPPHMVWGDISVPEKTFLEWAPYAKEILAGASCLLLEGSREELAPLIEILMQRAYHPE